MSTSSLEKRRRKRRTRREGVAERVTASGRAARRLPSGG